MRIQVNLLCAGNKVFVKYQIQGGGSLTPTSPCVRPWRKWYECGKTCKRFRFPKNGFD